MIVANFLQSEEKSACFAGIRVVKLLCLTRIQTVQSMRAYMNPR